MGCTIWPRTAASLGQDTAMCPSHLLSGDSDVSDCTDNSARKTRPAELGPENCKMTSKTNSYCTYDYWCFCCSQYSYSYPSTATATATSDTNQCCWYCFSFSQDFHKAVFATVGTLSATVGTAAAASEVVAAAVEEGVL